MVSSKVSEILWSNRICMTWQHCCMHEFTVAVTTYEVLKRNMSAKGPTWKRGKNHELAPLAEEFSTSNSCWMGKSQLSSGMWAQSGNPCSNR